MQLHRQRQFCLWLIFDSENIVNKSEHLLEVFIFYFLTYILEQSGTINSSIPFLCLRNSSFVVSTLTSIRRDGIQVKIYGV